MQTTWGTTTEGMAFIADMTAPINLGQIQNETFHWKEKNPISKWINSQNHRANYCKASPFWKFQFLSIHNTLVCNSENWWSFQWCFFNLYINWLNFSWVLLYCNKHLWLQHTSLDKFVWVELLTVLLEKEAQWDSAIRANTLVIQRMFYRNSALSDR